MDSKVHPLRRGTGLLVLLLAAGLVLTAACSSGSEATAADEPVVVTEEHDDAEVHDEGDEAHDEGDEGASAALEVAPKDQLFLVQMTNFAFTPNVLEAEAGEVIEIAIQNVEAVLHDFTIDKVDADLHVSYLSGTGEHAHDAEIGMEMADLHFALTEPGSGVVHIKVHEPGEYVFYCSVPGHREAGMVGTLIIR